MEYHLTLSEHAERTIGAAAATQGLAPEQYVTRFLEAWAARLTDEERDPDQAWFWSPEWQAGECAADADIANGRSTRYESDEDFLSALEAHVGDPTKAGADADS